MPEVFFTPLSAYALDNGPINRLSFLQQIMKLSSNWNCPGKWCQRLSSSWKCVDNWFWLLSVNWICSDSCRGLSINWKCLTIWCLVLSNNWNCPVKLFWSLPIIWNYPDSWFQRLSINWNFLNNWCLVLQLIGIIQANDLGHCLSIGIVLKMVSQAVYSLELP